MSDASRFSCHGCGKSYSWKQELAGRRVKCKCGQVMTVPQTPPGQEDPDELYDLAPAGDDVQSAFSKLRSTTAALPPSQPSVIANAVPLAYQQGPTQRERERMSSATLMDMKRDVHVPVALLIAGFALYVSYYAVRYNLGGGGLLAVGIGVGLLTAFKAALLVGFAFAVAGPLGVSFGGIWTAVLKLAAIAVFSDGVATWIDAGVAKMAGGAGGMFSGMMSFPIVLGIFWVLLIYLFSMDPGDSWLVVMLLAVFDMIVRTALMVLVLSFILGLGGISGAALPAAAIGGAGAAAALSSNDPMVEHVKQLKEMNLLPEARQYIAGGRQMALSKPTDDWYAAGCKNVWFEVSRDINGKLSPEALIVELPRDKEKRKKCYEILKGYYDEHDMPYDPEDLEDDGGAYIVVPVG